MFNITHGSTHEFLLKVPFGTPVGEVLSSQPTARSDPCLVAAECRPCRPVASRLFAWNRNTEKEKTMDEMNWDAGYGRISADVSSLEAQEKACSEFAQEMGFTELEFVYRECGSESDRPEFARLMQAARDGQMEWRSRVRPKQLVQGPVRSDQGATGVEPAGSWVPDCGARSTGRCGRRMNWRRCASHTSGAPRDFVEQEKRSAEHKEVTVDYF